MHILTRSIRVATLAGMTVSGVLLIAVMGLLVANVAVRLFGDQILGLYEVLAALSVVLLGLSLGDSQREKQHVTIDLVAERMPRPVQHAVAILTTAFSIVVFVFITVALVRYASLQVRAAVASELLKLPSWPALVLLIAGIVLLIAVLCIDGFRRAHSLADHSESELEERW